MRLEDYDKRFLALFLFLFVILIFSSIAAPSLTPVWYTIDATLVIFCLIAIAFYYITNDRNITRPFMGAVTQFIAYGSMQNDLTKNKSGIQKIRYTIFLGLLFAALFSIPIFVFPLINLSIVLPSTLSLTASTEILLSGIFIVAFLQPIFEEVFRAGIMDKTIASWSVTWLGLGIIITLTGALLMFFLYFTAFYIGFIILIIGILFTIFTRNKPIRWNIAPSFLNKQFGIITAAIILSGMHAYVLSTISNFQGAFIGLIIFFIIMSEINLYVNSIVPSIIIHSIYIALVFANGVLTTVIYGLLISGLLIFILYMLYPLNTRRK